MDCNCGESGVYITEGNLRKCLTCQEKKRKIVERLNTTGQTLKPGDDYYEDGRLVGRVLLTAAPGKYVLCVTNKQMNR